MRWRFWAGRRDRLVLTLIGVIVLGTGLSMIAILTDSIRGTVAKAYEQTWRAPYDILVHVPLAGDEKLPDLTEPNLLTTLPAGISVKQWQEIRSLPDVAVAAPIAVVGYVRAGPVYNFPSPETAADPGKGIYRITSKITATAAGVPEELTEESTVAVTDPKTGEQPAGMPQSILLIDHHKVGGIGIAAQIPTFLVGIDPEAENRLVGLDSSLTRGEGLVSGDRIREFTLQYPGLQNRTIPVAEIPVLVNEHGLRDLTYSVTIQELDGVGNVKRVVSERTLQGAQLAEAIRQGEKQYYQVLGQSGPISYDRVPSPYPDRWPVALALRSVASDLKPALGMETAWMHHFATLGTGFRSWDPTPKETQYQYKVKGYFDSALLSVVKDPRSQMPLMTYRPAEVTRVLDAAGRPINPPDRLSGGLSPVSFLSPAPAMLTTIEGAVALGGENSINAVQVKVQGADHFTPETVARVRQIAAEIERRTGLVAEVTMGSSPQSILVKVPDNRGWVEETWIHKNAAVTTVTQMEFGYSSYAVLVVLVAALYALATALTGVQARRRELGVAIAIGWPEGSLRRMVMAEQLLFACVAGLMAALAAALGRAPNWMVPGIFGLALLLYGPAIFASGYAAVRTAPGEALRWGDTAPGRRILPGTGITPLALSSLMGRPGRTLLTVVATALPTALLVVLTFISRRLQGTLYTTITGEYAALRVGPMQYASGAIALAIAAVTAFDLIRQNAADHRGERALLHAIGWPRWRIAATMGAEGAMLGFVAGLIGDLLGVLVLTGLYGSAVAGTWQIALLIWALPSALGLVTGLLGSLAELRHWDRAGLTGVRPEEVTRFGVGTRIGALALGLLLFGGGAVLTVSRLAETWRARAAGSGPSAAEMAATAISGALEQQNKALAARDTGAFLATLDPSISPFVMAERHWLEDLGLWQRAHEGVTVTRSVTKLTLLGINTAHVLVRQQFQGAKAASSVLDTVWIRSDDGHWLEHGYQHEVLQDGGITLWYPAGVDAALAQPTLDRAREALKAMGSAGYGLHEPLVLEIATDREALYSSLGPNLSSLVMGQMWAEYGEPLRLFLTDGPPAVNALVYQLGAKVAMERSNNHVPLWFKEGFRINGDAAVSHLTLQDVLRSLPAVAPAPPLQFLAFPTNPDRNSAEYGKLTVSGVLFIWYLRTQYGPDLLNRVFAQLTQSPPDLRMSGPAAEPERNELVTAAVEAATGKSWTQVSEEFRAWVDQQQLRR